MKILLLSRPIKNAGDFLFTKKAREAFQVLRPDAEIIQEHISKDFSINFLNGFSGVVVAGGPIYDDRFLRVESFPLLKYLNVLEPKLYFMSNGWYGETDDISTVFEYDVDQEVKNNLMLIHKKGGVFTCRDFLSETILRNIGLSRVKTIGCTAWYDYDFIDELKVLNNRQGIKKIVISDQGVTKNPDSWEWKYTQLIGLVTYIRNKFPCAELLFTFNGGIETKYSSKYNSRIANSLSDMNIKYLDISGDCEGFANYNDANLHIGYRVHSHIYCMSRRIPSVLLEEDARGAGTNRAMGLYQIRNYSYSKETYCENKYMIKQLDYYLDDLIQSQFKLLEPSYRIMNFTYYDKFVPFVMSVGE